MIDVAALYEAHGARVRAYIGRRLDDPETSADLAQEVWVRAIQHADRYVDTGAPVTSWLYRIAANLLADRYRQRCRRVSIVRLGDLKPFVTHVGTSDHVERIDAQHAIGTALGALTPPQRAVIVGRYYEGRRHDQMGHVATLDGSKKLQDRALVNLRKALEAA